MSGILNIFDIGKVSLDVAQRSLAVVSHNISNVNTPGYSKQEAIVSDRTPLDGAPGQIGRGAQVTSIRRSVNEQLEGRLTESTEKLGQYDVYHSALQEIESLFPDAQGEGLGKAISEFFTAAHDVANAPSDLTPRSVLLARGNALASRFNDTVTRLDDHRQGLDKQITQTLTKINDLADQIAELNGKIVDAENRGQQANDLRDTRQRALNDVATRIEVSTVEDSEGNLNVFVGKGQALVLSTTSFDLSGAANSSNNGFVDVEIATGGSSTLPIGSALTSGELKGLLDARDTTIPDLNDSLDRLAAAIVNEVNQVQTAGYDLDQEVGSVFFDALSVSSSAGSANTGSLTITGTISTASSLTYHDYTLTFGSAGAYTIVDATTGTSAAAGTYTGPGPTTLTAFDGLTMTFAGSTPTSGDTYTLSAHQDAAENLTVSLTDARDIAASSTKSGVPLNNANAETFAALQSKQIADLGNVSFNSFYSTIAGDFGASVKQAGDNLKTQTVVHDQLEGFRAEVSGVSLDEELIDLVKFQRAYQGAARLISVADELLQTLISLGK
jgi:flagellar hook-associated protein 1 FlgK